MRLLTASAVTIGAAAIAVGGVHVVHDSSPTSTTVHTIVTIVADDVEHPATARWPTGCDRSADPETQARLWRRDGAIRWLVDGELYTLWPEPGMPAVRVCRAAAQRLTALGIDADHFDAYRPDG